MHDLEFMWAGGNVKRYHTMRTLMEDTVGHHSYNVACIIMHLRPDASAALLRAGLKHDMAEHKLGDMPAPAKRELGIRTEFANRENMAMEAVGIAVEPLPKEDAWVLKLADALDGMRFCIQERTMGNRLVEECYDNFQRYAAELLFGPDKHPLRWYEDELQEPARFCDLLLFKYLRGQWPDDG